jgi:hypothetical protein
MRFGAGQAIFACARVGDPFASDYVIKKYGNRQSACMFIGYRTLAHGCAISPTVPENPYPSLPLSAEPVSVSQSESVCAFTVVPLLRFLVAWLNAHQSRDL